ncbi:cell division protein FtsB [Methylomarinovum caldicuralii]|uniref:Cell division protein FtsB n=1 Tax=Methylomarinovum caldicuralii TaxID=438856 RepID=A0AAU9C8C8_9GAMM|nr:septum formation initiator family protein [Methylomarinovum caldicuralii]BCX82289.1 cell division protein FtsB [Methylomarinovum caldicuralii]
MRAAVVILAGLLLALQYRLWFGDGGFVENRRLQARVGELRSQVAEQEEGNRALEAEVLDLKRNLAAVEERARRDLGMIRRGEIYVMVVPQ